MPVGMEFFPASDASAWDLIRRVIDRADYYIVVVGGRYGSEDDEGISYTEKEYEYAYAAGKPVIPFLHRHPERLRGNKKDTDEPWQKLELFRAKLKSRHHCAHWDSSEELRAEVLRALKAQIETSPAIGWIRADTIAKPDAVRFDDSRFELDDTYLELSDSLILDCDFEIEFRIVDDGGRSTNWFGVRLRGLTSHIFMGYLVYLRSNGYLDIVSANEQTILPKEVLTEVDPKADFVKMKVVLVGDQIRVWVDGKLRVNERNQLVPSAGKIDIRAFGSKVAIRGWHIQKVIR
jgi:hypothetical protein